MTNHVVRWITSLTAVPVILLFILYSSETVFFIFIIILIQIAVWEYNRLVFEKQANSVEKGTLQLSAFFIPLTVSLGGDTLLTAVVTFAILMTFSMFLFNITSSFIDLLKVGKVLLGTLYMPLLMSYLILLRHLRMGVLWVLFTLFVVFIGDISAYYIGRTFGKNKLQPFISPGKTREGTFGQVAGSCLGSVFFQTVFFNTLPLHDAIIIGILGGILAQLGDLFESAVKRSAGAKDAGYIIPGHGGIMDRLDSISFVVPFVFYYQQFAIR